MLSENLEITTTNGKNYSCSFLRFKIPRPKNFIFQYKPYEAISIKTTTSCDVRSNFNIKSKPLAFSDLINDHSSLASILKWIKSFDRKTTQKILIVSGPIGSGKTTAIKVICKMLKYTISQAEDVNLLDMNQAFGKVLVLYDNVDNHSQKDCILKFLFENHAKIQIPVLLVCNDLKSEYYTKFQSFSTRIVLKKPNNNQILKRLLSLCTKNGIKTDNFTLAKMIDICRSEIDLCITAINMCAFNREFNKDSLRSDTFRSLTSRESSAEIRNALNSIFVEKTYFAKFETISNRHDIFDAALQYYPQIKLYDKALDMLNEVQDYLYYASFENSISRQALFTYLNIYFKASKIFRTPKFQEYKECGYSKINNIWYLRLIPRSSIVKTYMETDECLKAAEELAFIDYFSCDQPKSKKFKVGV